MTCALGYCQQMRLVCSALPQRASARVDAGFPSIPAIAAVTSVPRRQTARCAKVSSAGHIDLFISRKSQAFWNVGAASPPL